MRRRVSSMGGIAAAAALLVLPALRAQAPARADAEYLLEAYDTYRSMAESSPYRTIPWQYLGPTNISARATDIDVADRNGARRIYVGYATSGVWKTDDNGATWQAVFEHQASTSIGDVASCSSASDLNSTSTNRRCAVKVLRLCAVLCSSPM